MNRNGANHNVTLVITFNVPAGDKQWKFLTSQGEIDRTLGVVKQNPM